LTPTEDISGKWEWLKKTMYTAASEVLGKSKRKTPDWFLENENRIDERL